MIEVKVVEYWLVMHAFEKKAFILYRIGEIVNILV